MAIFYPLNRVWTALKRGGGEGEGGAGCIQRAAKGLLLAGKIERHPGENLVIGLDDGDPGPAFIGIAARGFAIFAQIPIGGNGLGSGRSEGEGLGGGFIVVAELPVVGDCARAVGGDGAAE